MSTTAGRPRKPQPAAGRPKDERLLRELQRTAERIRLGEIATATFMLAVAWVTYVLAVAVADQALRPEGLPTWLRRVLFVGFLTSCGVFAWYRLIEPLCRRVSLMYAAWRLEKSARVTRHAMTAYLDLRERPLPSLVKEALRREAQEDLRYTDPEAAAKPGEWLRWFFVLVGLLILMGGFALFVPEQFLSLLTRAVAPFGETAIPPNTRFELLSPERDGPYVQPHKEPICEIAIKRGQPVTVRVKVHGLAPSDVQLETWVQQGEQPTRRTMEAVDQHRMEWKHELGASSIPASGLFFRVVGGDGQSRVYRLVEQLTNRPEVREFEITVHYPAYTRREPKTQTVGSIEALVGSKVELAVIADQPVVEGELILEYGQPRRQEVLQLIQAPDRDPNHQPNRVVLPQRLTLEEKLLPQARYSVVLRNKSKQINDLQWYDIRLIPDQPPTITLEQVGQEMLPPTDAKHAEPPVVRLRADAVVAVRGTANDDFAADRVWLVLQEVEGQQRTLRIAHEHAETGPLQKPNGFTPIAPAAYELTLDLSRAVPVKDPRQAPADSEAVRFAPGTKLRLWVEGTDCKQPEPNLSRSRAVLLELTEPLQPQAPPEKPGSEKPTPKNPASDQKPEGEKQPNSAEKPNSKPEDKSNKPDSSRENTGQAGESAQPDKAQANKPGERGTDDKAQSPDKAQPSGRAEEGQSPDKAQADKTNPKGGSGAGKPQPDKSAPDASKPAGSSEGSGRAGSNPQKPENQPAGGANAGSPEKPGNPQPGGRAQQGDNADKPSGENQRAAGNPSPGSKPEAKPQGTPEASSGQANKPGSQSQPSRQGPQPANPQAGNNAGTPANPKAGNDANPNPMAGTPPPPGQAQPGQANAGEKPNPSSGGNQQASGGPQKPMANESGQPSGGQQPGKPPQAGKPSAGNQQAGGPQKPQPGGQSNGNQEAGSGQKPDQGQSGQDNTGQEAGGQQPGNGQKPGQGQGQPGQANSGQQPGQSPQAENQSSGNQQPGGQQPGNGQKPGQGQGQPGQANSGQQPEQSLQAGNQSNGNQQAGGQQPGQGQPGGGNSGQQAGAQQPGQGSPSGQGSGNSPGGNASAQGQSNKPSGQPGPTSGGNVSGIDRQGPAQDNVLATKPMKPNPEFSEAAGDLTLDSLRKKIERGEIDKPTRELMDRLGVKTPEELQRLLRDKPQVVQGVLARGNRQATGPNRAATRDSRSADTDASERPVLPPELRDAYDEFTRRFRP